MDNEIRIIRGTTAYINIMLKDEDEEVYLLADGEVLRFGVKLSARSENYKLLKELTSADINVDGDGYTLRLSPADTEALPYAAYSYDVGLQVGLDYYNAIPCASFIIAPNITSREV